RKRVSRPAPAVPVVTGAPPAPAEPAVEPAAPLEPAVDDDALVPTKTPAQVDGLTGPAPEAASAQPVISPRLAVGGGSEPHMAAEPARTAFQRAQAPWYHGRRGQYQRHSVETASVRRGSHTRSPSRATPTTTRKTAFPAAATPQKGGLLRAQERVICVGLCAPDRIWNVRQNGQPISGCILGLN